MASLALAQEPAIAAVSLQQLEDHYQRAVNKGPEEFSELLRHQLPTRLIRHAADLRALAVAVPQASQVALRQALQRASDGQLAAVNAFEQSAQPGTFAM